MTLNYLKIFTVALMLTLLSCAKKSDNSDGGGGDPTTSLNDENGPHASTETTITVNWEDIVTGGANLVGYYIVYAEGAEAPADCSGDDRITASSLEDTTAVISGLKPGTQYTFRVCGFDSDGETFTTDEAVFTVFTQPEGSDPEGTQLITSVSAPSVPVISASGSPTESTVAITCGENGVARILKKSDQSEIVGNTVVTAGSTANLTITATALESVTSSDGLVGLQIECCNEAVDYCAPDTSKGITLDTTGPGDIGGFLATTGSQPGEIDLLVDLPTDVSDYSSIRVYRSAADAGSAPACGSGTLVDNTTDFSVDPYNRTVASLTQGSTYHFVACLHDLYDNVSTFGVTPSAASQAASAANYFFVSEASGQGNITLTAMDAACESEGDAGLVLGKTWKAFVSRHNNGPQQDAADYIFGTGEIFLVDGTTKIADDKADLFDGTIDAKINKEADGDIVADSTDVWAATESDGTRHTQDCSGWTENASPDDGRHGRIGLLDSTWIIFGGGNNCDHVKRWYCVSID